jgi:hypothetical protein
MKWRMIRQHKWSEGVVNVGPNFSLCQARKNLPLDSWVEMLRVFFFFTRANFPQIKEDEVSKNKKIRVPGSISTLGFPHIAFPLGHWHFIPAPCHRMTGENTMAMRGDIRSL